MTTSATESNVLVEDLDGAHAGVRVLRINRPQKRNALNLATKRDLAARLAEADDDPAVSVIVLTGSEAWFVAGSDIAEMATLAPTDHLTGDTGAVFSILDQLGTPTVAAVEGYALGGGCELAMACDIVVAGASARFGQPEIKVGLIPGAGGLSRLVQRCGRARALRMVLTGEPVGAAAACEMGIVSEVVDDGTALEVAVAIAGTIAGHPPLNVSAIRSIARHAEGSDLRTSIALERTTFQLLFDSADHSEGLKAFLDRRTPSYDGR